MLSKYAHELFEQGENNKLFVVGELGRQYFTKEGLEVDTEFKYTVQNPSLHRARVITERILELYNNNELDEVYIIYTKMENSFSMEAEMMKLLPLVKEDFMGKAPVDIYQEEIKADTTMQDILEHVVPNYVNGFIYGALVESFASEHNSRMMAMQAATDSAKEMGELDGEFHRIIFAASKSRPLQNVLTSFHNYIRRARAVSVCVTGRAEESVSEHRAILEAITKHDGELAEKLTAEHIKNARDNIATTVHTSCEP